MPSELLPNLLLCKALHAANDLDVFCVQLPLGASLSAAGHGSIAEVGEAKMVLQSREGEAGNRPLPAHSGTSPSARAKAAAAQAGTVIGIGRKRSYVLLLRYPATIPFFWYPISVSTCCYLSCFLRKRYIFFHRSWNSIVKASISVFVRPYRASPSIFPST